MKLFKLTLKREHYLEKIIAQRAQYGLKDSYFWAEIKDNRGIHFIQGILKNKKRVDF